MALLNPNSPGKGISKEAAEKRSILQFFEVYVRNFWKLTCLNAMYAIIVFPFFCYALLFVMQAFGYDLSVFEENHTFAIISLITNGLPWYFSEILILISGALVGPATAAATYIWKSMSRGEHVWLVSDFFEKIKENFIQGLLVFALEVLVYLSLVIYLTMDYSVFGKWAIFMSIFRYAIIVIALVFTMLQFYTYSIMITFRLPTKTILKNAGILCVLGIFRNVFVLIIELAVAALTSVLLLPVMLVFTYSVCGLFRAFVTYPLVDTLLLQPARANNTSGSITIEDTVFKDDAGNGKE